MARLIIEACKVEKTTWGRLLVYLADKTITGDRLGEPESSWLSKWMTSEGLEDPSRTIVVQVAKNQVAKEVFGGYLESASRAVEGLERRGIIRLVHKGVKGHGSLYFRGTIPKGGNAYTKTRQNVYENAKQCLHDSEENLHGSSGFLHVEGPVTCGNAPTFNLIKANSNKDDGLEEARKQCVRCGSENVIPSYGPGILECRDCNAAFPASNRKTETRSRDPSRG